MSNITNQTYLLNDQYRTGSNLNARMELHARFSTSAIGWHRWVFDQLDIPEPGTMLELGCGPGTLWTANADRIPEGWRITLSDFSSGMLEEARANLQSVEHRFTYETIDAQSIPMPESSFDAGIANHMLYHVPDRGKALSEICRVLKPEGHFYAATNGRGHMRELGDLYNCVGISVPPNRLAFELENGAEELSACFGKVDLRLYEDELRVTEVEPVMAYLLSMPDAPLTDNQLAEIRRVVSREIADQGAFHITKSSGMFVCSA